MIAGTGIKVLDVAVRYEVMGMTPEEIMVALPHLDLPRIHAALSYYYAHKTELDKEWKASLKKVARLRANAPPLKPSQIAERVQENEPPLNDIASEVHRMRREARRRRG